jgi:hypothetical protein
LSRVGVNDLKIINTNSRQGPKLTTRSRNSVNSTEVPVQRTALEETTEESCKNTEGGSPLPPIECPRTRRDEERAVERA